MGRTATAEAPKRKPRQPYTGEELEAKRAALAAALATTADEEKPEGNAYLSALAAGLPRSTAREWMELNDEGFNEERRQFKKAFHGEALGLMRKLTAAVHEAVDDPERRAKANIRDLTIAAATWYDKAALAAGEGQQSGLAAFAAGLMFGRAVERQQHHDAPPPVQDIEARVLD